VNMKKTLLFCIGSISIGVMTLATFAAGRSEIADAAMKGDKAAVRTMIQQKMDVNSPQPDGATALLDGIIKVADYMKDVEGRRVIVIVSDGEDTISDLDTTLEKVTRRLLQADCQVYVVKTKDFENYKRTGLRQGNANIRVLDAERRMLEISGQTGGAVYSPLDESELNDAFNQISAELSDQYILSYYPDSDADKGGEFRSISVTIKGKQNMTVRTRKGYYVPKRTGLGM